MLTTALLDAAFGHPRGLLGRVGGLLMSRGNAEQEAAAIRRAELAPGDRVLVVGHGPGTGLARAADAVAPSGSVVGVDPSEVMRRMALRRCAGPVSEGLVEVRDGTAETTGLPDASVDAAISVNNVMLWDLRAGLEELARVLRPDGRLVVSVHQHVLTVPLDALVERVEDAGFDQVSLDVVPRPRTSPAVDLTARRGGSRT